MHKPNSPEQLALDLLPRSRLKVQVAAVIVDKSGRFISWGWNHGYEHAEIHAIRRANPKRLPGSIMYVAGRRAKSGNPVFSRPCGHCHALIASYGINVTFRDKQNLWRKTWLD